MWDPKTKNNKSTTSLAERGVGEHRNLPLSLLLLLIQSVPETPLKDPTLCKPLLNSTIPASFSLQSKEIGKNTQELLKSIGAFQSMSYLILPSMRFYGQVRNYLQLPRIWFSLFSAHSVSSVLILHWLSISPRLKTLMVFITNKPLLNLQATSVFSDLTAFCPLTMF